MNVLLVDYPENTEAPESGWSLGYRSMAAVLRARDFTVAILHPPRLHHRLAEKALIEEILRVRPKIVGFTTFDENLGLLLSFIRKVRKAGCTAHITLGGQCATFIAETLLRRCNHVDSVIRGEGEYSLLELVERICRGRSLEGIQGLSYRDSGRVVSERPRRLIEDLDDLPMPVFDHLDLAEDASPLHFTNGRILIASSRGCYGTCSFCSIQPFYRSCGGRIWRGRSATLVVDEMKRLLERTGYIRVTFIDDNFMGPGKAGRDHAASIAGAILASKASISFNIACRPNDVDTGTFKLLKEAGLAAVSLGVESMSPATLSAFHKQLTVEQNRSALQRLEELELWVEILFIFFHPLMTLEEIRPNLSFIEHVRKSQYAYFSHYQPFNELIPLHGSEMSTVLRKKGLLTGGYRSQTLRYADSRVGFIAQQVLDVPFKALHGLRASLPVDGGSRVRELEDILRKYEFYLNMERLPALVDDLCRSLQKNPSAQGREIRTIVRAFNAEKNRIASLVRCYDAATK